MLFREITFEKDEKNLSIPFTNQKEYCIMNEMMCLFGMDS